MINIYTYFGARYYDSDLSSWLSVDPMASERSWVSPYSYCQNSPVMRVDPTGALDGEPDKWKHNRNTGEVTWEGEEGGTSKQTITTVEYDGRETEYVVDGKGFDINGELYLANDNGKYQGGKSYNSLPKVNIQNMSCSQDGLGGGISIINGAYVKGVGVMGDFGTFVDSEGNAFLYLTVGVASGWGETVGGGGFVTSKGFKGEDMEGSASGVSGSIGPISPEWFSGGNGNVVGANVGIGQAYYAYRSYTFVLAPPPPSAWTKPGAPR